MAGGWEHVRGPQDGGRDADATGADEGGPEVASDARRVEAILLTRLELQISTLKASFGIRIQEQFILENLFGSGLRGPASGSGET